MSRETISVLVPLIRMSKKIELVTYLVEDPDFCESRIYKKDRKTKEFPRIEGTIFEMG
jgi:hypothetical protein